jgi:peptidoglycan/LPS O-acetylase OafA/YrhL
VIDGIKYLCNKQGIELLGINSCLATYAIIAISFLVGFLSFQLVEKPFMQLASKLYKQL